MGGAAAHFAPSACGASGERCPLPAIVSAQAAAIVRAFKPYGAEGFMASTRFDVLGIGNAIVDVLARTDDDFLVKQGMHKGGMALIDEPRAATIYEAMGPAIEVSGGSAANTDRRGGEPRRARGLRRQGAR